MFHVCLGFQLQVFQKEEIEPLQVKQQEVNWLGQGLIQSAAKSTNTENLEHDLEDVNTRWKTLNKKVIILDTILLLLCSVFWLLACWCLSKHRKLNIHWEYELHLLYTITLFVILRTIFISLIARGVAVVYKVLPNFL